MAVSVIRKLERCERIGIARQGEANYLVGENYQVIKYKIKIKDYFTTNREINELRGSLIYVAAPSHEKIKPDNLPAWRLQNLQAQAAACKESSPSPPCKLHQINLHEHGDSQQNLHEQEDEMYVLQSLQNYEEQELSWLQHRWMLQGNVMQYSKKSLQALPLQPLKLQPNTMQENEEAGCESSPWKLQESSNKPEEEINWPAPTSSPNLQQTAKEREEDPSTPWKLQKDTEDEMELVGSGEDGRGGERTPWKLQKEVHAEKAGGGVWEGVKKMECECCGMEEECTGGYEEKVREGLKGHWLCGLCEEAVGEERKRVGGNVQAALAAHMQPCRRFSRRARSKASPPPSDVAVPHAVCRLLSRHLSTPSPRRQSSPLPLPSLSRCSSCLPSLPN